MADRAPSLQMSIVIKNAEGYLVSRYAELHSLTDDAIQITAANLALSMQEEAYKFLDDEEYN